MSDLPTVILQSLADIYGYTNDELVHKLQQLLHDKSIYQSIDQFDLAEKSIKLIHRELYERHHAPNDQILHSGNDRYVYVDSGGTTVQYQHQTDSTQAHYVPSGNRITHTNNNLLVWNNQPHNYDDIVSITSSQSQHLHSSNNTKPSKSSKLLIPEHMMNARQPMSAVITSAQLHHNNHKLNYTTFRPKIKPKTKQVQPSVIQKKPRVPVFKRATTEHAATSDTIHNAINTMNELAADLVIDIQTDKALHEQSAGNDVLTIAIDTSDTTTGATVEQADIHGSTISDNTAQSNTAGDGGNQSFDTDIIVVHSDNPLSTSESEQSKSELIDSSVEAYQINIDTAHSSTVDSILSVDTMTSADEDAWAQLVSPVGGSESIVLTDITNSTASIQPAKPLAQYTDILPSLDYIFSVMWQQRNASITTPLATQIEQLTKYIYTQLLRTNNRLIDNSHIGNFLLNIKYSRSTIQFTSSEMKLLQHAVLIRNLIQMYKPDVDNNITPVRSCNELLYIVGRERDDVVTCVRLAFNIIKQQAMASQPHQQWNECTLQDQQILPSGELAPINIVKRTKQDEHDDSSDLYDDGNNLCQYQFGSPHARPPYYFNLLWTWRPARVQYDKLLCWQRINHYPDSRVLTRKDLLKKCIDRYSRLSGYKYCDQWSVMPITYVLPNESHEFQSLFDKCSTQHEYNYWISKPCNLSRGRGIRLIHANQHIDHSVPQVIQQYITAPLLLSGHKFDLRLYVLVTSFNPLECYMYQNGFARFATEPYTNHINQLDNQYIHLTNSSINNQRGSIYGNGHVLPESLREPDQIECGNKISLYHLNTLIQQQYTNVDIASVWQNIELCVLKTLLCADDHITNTVNSFELFGFDIMLDDQFHAWLIEVNASPSMSLDTHIDQLTKPQLIADTIQLINPLPYDRVRLNELLIHKVQSSMYMDQQKHITKQQQNDQSNQLLSDILNQQQPRVYGVPPQHMGDYKCLAPSKIHDKLIRMKRAAYNVTQTPDIKHKQSLPIIV